jgi:Tol biopolymer transport system component
MAVPFNLDRLELTGSPFEILKGVVTSDFYGVVQFGFSRDGTLIYAPGGPEFYYNKLVWINRQGEVRPFPLEPPLFGAIRFSPDGQRLAIEREGGTAQIWLYEFSRGTMTRLTDEWDNQSPVWTPDGEWVIFQKSKPGAWLFRQLADGSAPAEQIHFAERGLSGMGWPSSMSPDGRFLAYTQELPPNGWDNWILPMKGEPIPSLLIATRFNEDSPMFSPDGKWIAYSSDETGQSEVYVQPFPGPSKRWQISTNGGWGPRWGPNGRELFYRTDDKMMVVAVHTDPAFSAMKPKLLFGNPSLSLLPFFDITPDGQQFVMIQKGEQSTPPTKLHVVLNWFEEIKRKAASRN